MTGTLVDMYWRRMVGVIARFVEDCSDFRCDSFGKKIFFGNILELSVILIAAAIVDSPDVAFKLSVIMI